jgi:hypothetical protein
MTAPRYRSANQGASFSAWAKKQPWRARVYVRGKNIQVGYFTTREEALEARADAVRRHLGDGLLKGMELA